MIEKERLHPDDQSNWHGWISYICGKWEIARRYQPKSILEIGVRTGYSAWAFLQAHPNAKYVGLDDYSYGNYPDWAKENLLKGYDVAIYKMDTQFAGRIPYCFLPSVGPHGEPFEGGKFDFIHVDGDHRKAGVMHDLDLALDALANDGVILIDDYDRIPEVKQGIDEFLTKHSYLAWKYCESFTGDILIGNINLCLPENKQSEIQTEQEKALKDMISAYEDPKNKLNTINMTFEDFQKLERGELDEGKGSLLVFHHGLGDVLLFKPLYEHLKKEGKYGIALQAGCGFAPLFEDALETPAGEFDYDRFCKEHGYISYQIIRFDMSEGSGKTKTEECAEREFAIRDFKFSEIKWFAPDTYYGIAGVNFQGTCLPGQTNPDYDTAKAIWEEIKQAGYIPIEICFEHVFHNPVNKRFDFVDRSTRDWAPDVLLLREILDTCKVFIGVTSGVWVAAMTRFSNDGICCLEKAFKATDYIPNYPKESCIDINNYQPGAVEAWLNTR